MGKLILQSVLDRSNLEMECRVCGHPFEDGETPWIYELWLTMSENGKEWQELVSRHKTCAGECSDKAAANCRVVISDEEAEAYVEARTHIAN